MCGVLSVVKVPLLWIKSRVWAVSLSRTCWGTFSNGHGGDGWGRGITSVRTLFVCVFVLTESCIESGAVKNSKRYEG